MCELSPREHHEDAIVHMPLSKRGALALSGKITNLTKGGLQASTRLRGLYQNAPQPHITEIGVRMST